MREVLEPFPGCKSADPAAPPAAQCRTSASMSPGVTTRECRQTAFLRQILGCGCELAAAHPCQYESFGLDALVQ
jgi:hypothetical protein